MKYSLYRKTAIKRADAVAAEGAVPIGCKVVKSGILPALSPEKISETAFSEVDFATYSRAGDGFLICADGKVYLSCDGVNYSELISFSAAKHFYFYERSGGAWKVYVPVDGRCVFYGAEGWGVENTPLNLSCGVMRCGRLFGADASDGYKLRWSGEGGAFDWTEGISGAGWLYLDPAMGEILSVHNLGAELIAVRKYGLTLLKVYGNPENFSVAPVNFATSEISSSSAAVTGGTLTFYCKDGLYRFDGNTLVECGLEFGEEIESLSGAVSAGGDFYARIKRASGGDGILFVGADGSAFIINCPAKALAVRGDEIFAFCLDGIYLLQTGGEYRFTSGALDFGTSEEKALSRITVDGFALTAEIYNGEQTRVFSNVKGRLSVHMRGVSFKITVTGTRNINGITAYAEVPYDV